MALARLVTFVPFTLIKSADVNGEINNILSNPIALISPTTGPINFNGQAHTGLLPSAITATSGSPGQVVVASTAVASGGILAGLGGSRVKGLLGFISSQSGTFSADQYMMQTTAGIGGYVVNATSSFSASVGTAGPAAGGRDIAGSFASTYVHWYAITTGPNSTAPAGLVSTNPPNIGPVALPAGYSALCYLGGSVYTSASTTVALDHAFRGGRAFYVNQAPITLNAGTGTVDTVVSLSTAMPPNSLGSQNTFTLNVLSSAGATAYTLNFSLKTSVGAVGFYNPLIQNVSVSGANIFIPLPTFHILNTANQFLYAITITTATSANLTSALISYDMPNGA